MQRRNLLGNNMTEINSAVGEMLNADRVSRTATVSCSTPAGAGCPIIVDRSYRPRVRSSVRSGYDHSL